MPSLVSSLNSSAVAATPGSVVDRSTMSPNGMSDSSGPSGEVGQRATWLAAKLEQRVEIQNERMNVHPSLAWWQNLIRFAITEERLLSVCQLAPRRDSLGMAYREVDPRSRVILDLA